MPCSTRPATRWARAASGWQNGKPLTLTILVDQQGLGGAGLRTFQLLAADFAKVGVKLNEDALDTAAMFTKLYGTNDNYAGGWDALLETNSLDYDPAEYLVGFTSSSIGTYNWNGWSNQHFDSLYLQSNAAFDAAKRKAIVYAAQQYAYQQRIVLGPGLPAVRRRPPEHAGRASAPGRPDRSATSATPHSPQSTTWADHPREAWTEIFMRSRGDYILRRIAAAIGTLFVAVSMNFLLFRILPGSAAVSLSHVPGAGPALRQALTREFGLNHPLGIQYLLYFWQLLHLNLGVSFYYHQPVLGLLTIRPGQHDPAGGYSAPPSRSSSAC